MWLQHVDLDRKESLGWIMIFFHGRFNGAIQNKTKSYIMKL